MNTIWEKIVENKSRIVSAIIMVGGAIVTAIAVKKGVENQDYEEDYEDEEDMTAQEEVATVEDENE